MVKSRPLLTVFSVMCVILVSESVFINHNLCRNSVLRLKAFVLRLFAGWSSFSVREDGETERKERKSSRREHEKEMRETEL